MRFLTSVRSHVRSRSSNKQKGKDTATRERNSSQEPRVSTEAPKINWWKCKLCQKAPDFSSQALYKQHMENIHELTGSAGTKVWSCSEDGCRDVRPAWTRFEAYKSHMNTEHNITDTLRLWDGQVTIQEIESSPQRTSSGAGPSNVDSQLPSYRPSPFGQTYQNGPAHPPQYCTESNSNPPAYVT